MILRPQKSTLFPYTTLFRSLMKNIVLISSFAAMCLGLIGCATVQKEQTEKPSPNITASAPKKTSHAPVGYTEDRKSTRLNSSHANISYAVFCLKKKKNKA